MNTVNLLARILALSLLASGCKVERANRPESSPKISNPIEEMLRSPAGERREGIAAVILIDTSGSMAKNVPDINGELKPKIEIGRRSAIDLVRQFERYAQENPAKTISLGIYEFSSRKKDESPVREVVKNGSPNLSEAEVAINRLKPLGGTPIGNAMIIAKRALDATALSRRHMAVVTDGLNTEGYNPGDVADVMSREGAEQRISIYFIAFDVAAESFNNVRAAGGLVLGAANESDLKQAIDYILTGKILVEQPIAPSAR